MKLKEWAEKTGIKYLTAYRWFRAGDIPGAYQTGSGTILVPDDMPDEKVSNDAMSLFLKKTVEYSKSNSSVEDFAAYVISNFQIKLQGAVDAPKYSKNKPKQDEVQKHFQQFLPDKEKEEQLKAIKSAIKEQNKGDPRYENPTSADVNILEQALEEPDPFSRTVEIDDMDEEYGDMSEVLCSYVSQDAVRLGGPIATTDGLVTRSVDLNTTPQQINYIGSTSQAISGSDFSSGCTCDTSTNANPALSGLWHNTVPNGSYTLSAGPTAAAFLPTLKEIQSAVKVIEQAADKLPENLPRKRGRKPTFNKR